MSQSTDRMLNLLQTAAIVVGLAYGAVQIAQFRGEQRRQAEVELARSFSTPEFHQAYAVVLNMPDSLDMAAIQAQYAADWPGILMLTQTFETVGILVHGGELRLSTVDDFLGTGIVTSWGKLQHSVLEYREDFDAPSVAEWFQWLAERLEEYRATQAPAPAYEAFRYWRPTR